MVVRELPDQVAAEADLHARGARDLDRPQARVQHDLVLLQAVV